LSPHGIDDMQLSDTDIKRGLDRGEIFIEPFDPDRLQSASYDVLLGNEFLIFDRHKILVIDPRKNQEVKMTKIKIQPSDHFIIHPGQFCLGVTADKIGVDDAHSCQIDGKSSMARYGLIVHTTAGYVDPGNNLNITLELFNCNSVPIILYPNMKIAQMRFYRLLTPATRPYGSPGLNSKYFGSTSIQASKMHKNWTEESEL
jgi:dCTP deaminase